MSTSKQYVYDPAQGKVVERSERWIPVSEAPFVIEDTMPLTKSPLNGKLYFQSKSALRKHYKQHGYEEIGTSYENEEWLEREEANYAREREFEADRKIRNNLIDRVIHGKR
jgi:hypothetical protein